MKCSYKTKTGKPCGMAAVDGTSPAGCFNHARAAARSAGGLLRGAQLAAQAGGAVDGERPHWWGLRQPWEVAAALADVSRRLLENTLDAKRAAVATKALVALAPLTERYERGADDGDGSDYQGERDEAEADA